MPLIAGEILALVHLETGVSKDRKHIGSKRGIDAIQKANSGYSGLPMAEAPTAYVPWSKCLNVNPETGCGWTNRDRFIFSAEHG
ncbi:hypothetical protein BTA31_17540 [Bacillus haynesii]|uniref:Transketolase N-terminal domain-containing protein n=1 Tax=Bacillus haynesii TaxID=1925021 RepID=A0ABX3HZQ4_9BACI|nr:hypothetical protein BTA31_17540 [Bacillus haynesii]